jgi:hypothetical protein
MAVSVEHQPLYKHCQAELMVRCQPLERRTRSATEIETQPAKIPVLTKMPLVETPLLIGSAHDNDFAPHRACCTSLTHDRNEINKNLT